MTIIFTKELEVGTWVQKWQVLFYSVHSVTLSGGRCYSYSMDKTSVMHGLAADTLVCVTPNWACSCISQWTLEKPNINLLIFNYSIRGYPCYKTYHLKMDDLVIFHIR